MHRHLTVEVEALAAIATGTFIRLAASTGSSASCSHHVVPSSAPSQTATTSRTRHPRRERPGVRAPGHLRLTVLAIVAEPTTRVPS